MKCTNRINDKKINKFGRAVISSVIIASLLMLCACGAKDVSTSNDSPYDVYETSAKYGLSSSVMGIQSDFFASDICVIGKGNYNAKHLKTSIEKSAGMFDLNNKEVRYAKKIFRKMYPASTTKILTAYIAVKYGNLSDKITVSSKALDIPSDSSTCGLQVGDELTLQDLLYGLMLSSGNDAANVIAEYVSGSPEKFAKLMNKEAKAMGATHSHFINPHGLHDDNHYTTAYDLYLMFNKAIKNEDFYTVISASEYDASYKNSAGSPVNVTWSSTNWYKNGTAKVPENVTILGGKTGTTYSAGACLVLLSKNKKEEPFISIVLHASTHDDLYNFMSQILTEFSE